MSITIPAHGTRLECCEAVKEWSDDKLGSAADETRGFFWLQHSMVRADSPAAITPGWYFRASFESGFLSEHVGPLHFCPFCGRSTELYAEHMRMTRPGPVAHECRCGCMLDHKPGCCCKPCPHCGLLPHQTPAASQAHCGGCGKGI